MTELPLLVNIAVALVCALAGGLIAQRLRLSPIVGYMLAGIAIGPFTPGFHGDEHVIHQLSEFGVILLMFGIGLHFSFRDLWQVRNIAIPGAIMQMAVSTGLGYLLARATGSSPTTALVLGIAISVASTVVLLRGLMDHGLLDTLHGRVAIGWLVFEDLATVIILVLLPLLALPPDAGSWLEPASAVGKALVFVILMLTAGPRVVSLVLGSVVRARSRELFILLAITAALGTALASAAVFGVSLALGAFLAGVIFGGTPFSHQVGADLLPFRDAFAVLFFVSVGMLVDPVFVWTHIPLVLAWSGLVVIGKGLTTVVGGMFFPYPAKTTLVVAAGLSQIGEFSFILGQSGLALGILSREDYSIILTAAIVSIAVNPLLFHAVGRLNRLVLGSPTLRRLLDRPPPSAAATPDEHTFNGHVVIVGCGRVGRHISQALGRLNVPRVIIESDPARLEKLTDLGVPVLYGDASNSEILKHVGLERARALVITVPDDASALAVAKFAREQAPHVPVIARAATWDGEQRLVKAGVSEVVRPELEGGVEIVRRALLGLHLPARDVQRYVELVRREGLDETATASDDRLRTLDDLRSALDVDITWVTVEAGSPLAGTTLAEAALRSRTGASVVAIARDAAIEVNPAPAATLAAGDRIALLGSNDAITGAVRALRPTSVE